MIILETRLEGEDLFDRLEIENDSEKRKFSINNQAIDDLCKKYDEWTRSSQCECEAPTIIGDAKFTAKEIQEFLIQRAKLDANAGYFISALINSSPDTDFIIDLYHLDSELKYLGFNNTKNIIFFGERINQMGRGMTSGIIKIEGNAESFIGNGMNGGEIIIYGNVGDFCGHSMEGGKIKIYGDAGQWLGQKMFGGEIFLYGKYRSLGEKIYSGNIYQKKRFFPRWRKLR